MNRKYIVFCLLLLSISFILCGCLKQLVDLINNGLCNYKGQIQNLSLTQGAKEIVVAQSGDGKVVTASVSEDGSFSIYVPTRDIYVISFYEDTDGDGEYDKFDGTCQTEDSSGPTDLIGSKGGEVNLGNISFPASGNVIDLVDTLLTTIDTDVDGTMDYSDSDCDGNGTVDTEQEEYIIGSDDDDMPSFCDPDDDNDGIVDSSDPDDNDDGVADTEDVDSDGDGIPDDIDLDDTMVLLIGLFI